MMEMILIFVKFLVHDVTTPTKFPNSNQHRLSFILNMHIKSYNVLEFSISIKTPIFIFLIRV
jgi:hypothetical protein